MIIPDTKQRIQKAAHDLVMQYSIRSVSMDDIVAHLGMSKKTIYQYFKDKDELVEAVVDGEIPITSVPATTTAAWRKTRCRDIPDHGPDGGDVPDDEPFHFSTCRSITRRLSNSSCIAMSTSTIW